MACQYSSNAPDLGFYPRRSCSSVSSICSWSGCSAGWYCSRSGTSKEVEILVLRHEVAASRSTSPAGSGAGRSSTGRLTSIGERPDEQRKYQLRAIARVLARHRLSPAPTVGFTSGGESFRRLLAPTAYTGSIWACPSGGGPRADLTRQEAKPSGHGHSQKSCVIPAPGSKNSASSATTASPSTGFPPPASSSRCCRSRRPRPAPKDCYLLTELNYEFLHFRDEY